MTLCRKRIVIPVSKTIVATTIVLLLAGPALTKDAKQKTHLNDLKREREYLQTHHIEPTKLAVENLESMLSQEVLFVSVGPHPGHKMSGFIPAPKTLLEKTLTFREVNKALSEGRTPNLDNVDVELAKIKKNDLIVRETMRNKLVDLKRTYSKQVKDLNRLNAEISKIEKTQREALKPKSSPAVIDLSGKWNTSYYVEKKMVTYTITQTKGATKFSWQISGPGLAEETRKGVIKGKNGVSIEYKRTAGHRKSNDFVKVSGTASTKPGTNKASKITWRNGVVWTKATATRR